MEHKNTMGNLLGNTSYKVLRWHHFLEEYNSEFVYIKGIHNTISDSISFLDRFSLGRVEDIHMNLIYANEIHIIFVSWLEMSNVAVG